MSTEVALFDQPVQLPAYLQTDAAKALAKQMGGGLDGGEGVNRLSLRGMKYRFQKGGAEVHTSHNPTLEVVIVAATPHVSRLYYEKAFDPNEAGTRPDCYSRDGRAPEADSPEVQSSTCATCPQNAKGSAKNGVGKACAFKKRVIITAPNAIDGDKYALDVGSMSMFGDDLPAQKLFNFKSYLEKLSANGLNPATVITRLTFDEKATVSKLFFTPVRPLVDTEWAKVTALLGDPEISRMLGDIDNKTEVGQPITKPTPAQVAAPAAPAAPVVDPLVEAEKAKKRAAATAAKAAAKAAPVAAPAPAGFPTGEAAPAPAAAPAAQGGFGFEAAPAAAPTPQAPANPSGFTISLDGFDD